MNTIEIAKQLQRAIQQDPAFIRFSTAKFKNDNDPDLQRDIIRFEELKGQIESMLGGEHSDEIKQLNDELKSLYTKIMTGGSMQEYSTAKQELDKLKEQINGIIAQAFGLSKQPCSDGGCGSSCGGCGSH